MIFPSSLKHCQECPAEGPEVLVDFMSAFHLRPVKHYRPCRAKRLEPSMFRCSSSQRDYIYTYIYIYIGRLVSNYVLICNVSLYIIYLYIINTCI